MGATFIGFILGVLAGAVTGTELGVVAGGVLGTLLGLSVHAFGWIRSHLGDAPTVERHRIVCAVYGQTADCDFAGDLYSGRWYDVRRCSLLPVPTRVDCDKGCLPLMTSTRTRPGRGCSCSRQASESNSEAAASHQPRSSA
jgi:hypothetical protein